MEPRRWKWVVEKEREKSERERRDGAAKERSRKDTRMCIHLWSVETKFTARLEAWSKGIGLQSKMGPIKQKSTLAVQSRILLIFTKLRQSPSTAIVSACCTYVRFC